MSSAIKKENLNVLDSFRGLAAIYVVFSHARWLLWEGYGEGYKLHPESYTFFNKFCVAFFGIFRFGHEAVIFFFVLSGFVIHYSSSKYLNNEGLNVGLYLYKRFKRIYPPFILAIVLTFLLDCLGKYYFHFPLYSSATPYPSINNSVHYDHSLTTLFGNLLFVQTVYTPVWGSNGVLWSLMYEWWFYILYIPILFVFRKNKILTSLIILVVWNISMRFGLGPLLLTTVFNYFICWYVGMLLAEYLLQDNNKRYYITYMVLIVISGSLFFNNRFGQHTVLSVFIVLALYLALTNKRLYFLNKLSFLGGFSYTLYVIHVPMLRLISGMVMSKNNGYLPRHFGYIPLAVTIVVTIAYGLHFIVEKPFITKRR